MSETVCVDIHTYIHFFITRTLRAQVTDTKYLLPYNLDSVTICHHVLLHLCCLGVLLLLLLLPQQSLYRVTRYVIVAVLHTSYFILHTCWTELTLRRERQLYFRFLPKGIYVFGSNSDPKVPDVANLQLHTLTN